MKKRLSLCIITLLIALGSLGAQSLQDNADYRQSLELKRQSDEAFAAGNYEEAKSLAEESLLYVQRSDAWISMMLNRYRANSALRMVNERLAQAAVVQAEIHFPEEYAEGKRLYQEAYQFFQEESYVPSRDSSMAALEALKVIVYVRSESTKPSFYVVRLLAGNTDCLWNIAGYDFIYNNPWEWRRIYEANKEAMPESENPHLIFPGMVLTIPNLAGESRSGTWRNGAIE